MTAFNCISCGKYIGWGPNYEGTDQDGKAHKCLTADIERQHIKKLEVQKATEEYFKRLREVGS